MTKQDLFGYLCEGGLQAKVLSAKNSFEIIEGYDVETEFHVPPYLYELLKLLEDRGDDVRLLGRKVFPIGGLVDIKMVKKG